MQHGVSLNANLVLFGIILFTCAYKFSAGPVMWMLFTGSSPPKSAPSLSPDLSGPQIYLRFQHADPTVFARKFQRHDRANLGFTLHPDLPAVLPHDTLHDHETKATSTRFGRVVRFEQTQKILLFDAGSRIAKHQENRIITGARFKMQLTSRFHRFHGVFKDIKKHLLELIAIGHDHRQIWRGLHVDRDFPILKFALLKPQNFVHHIQ